MQPTRQRRSEVLLCAVLTGLSASIYTDFFGGWGIAPVLAAALVPAAAVVAMPARWSAGRQSLVLAALLPVAGTATVVALPGGDGLSVAGAAMAFVRGLVDGWAAMLAAGTPADLAPDLVATPFAVVWLATSAAALVATRTTAPWAPAGPAVIALVAALTLVGGPDGYRPVLAGAFVGTALVLAATRANRIIDQLIEAAYPPDEQGLREEGAGEGLVVAPRVRLAVSVPLVLGIAVAGPLAAGLLPPGRDERFDPRSLRTVRLDLGETVSPLVGLKAQLKSEPPESLFRIELIDPAGAAPDRVRTAALETYDGALWTTSAEYRRAGRVLAADPALTGDAAGVLVRQRVTVLGLDGPFLPAAGRPIGVETDDRSIIGFDAAGGTLVSDRSSLQGMSYEVLSRVSAPTDEELAAATPSDDPALEPLRVPPPGLPAELTSVARTWVAGATTRSDELLALRDALRAVRYDDSSDAEPGHSLEALRRVLVGEEAEREGYAEQFAAAYAVLARTRGFPARVATGYLLPPPDGEGVVTVTEDDAHAWPEVHLAGYGWVAIEPTGERVPSAREPDDDPAPPGRAAPQAADAARPGPPEPPAVIDAADDHDTAAGGGFVTPARGGGLAVALLALVLLPAGAKRVRRSRRRRARTAARRVAGAWRETLDRLTELGVPLSSTDTPTEVAARVGRRFPNGAEPAAEMAALVDAAIYGAGEPDAAQSDEAWRLAGRVGAGVRRGAGRGRRIRAWFDPRPLLRRPGHPGGRPAVRAVRADLDGRPRTDVAEAA